MKRLIVTLWLGIGACCLGQGNSPNPFGPLGGFTAISSPTQSMAPQAPASRLTGIVWNVQQSVAIVDNTVLPEGTFLGQRQVARIDLQRILFKTHEEGTEVMELPPRFTVSPEDLQTRDPNQFYLFLDNCPTEAALEALALQRGFNLLIEVSLPESISLKLKRVSWDTAIETLCQAIGCSYRHIGLDSLRILPAGQIVTRSYPLKYATAENIQQTLADLLSNDGKIGIDTRLNALLISDREEDLQRIEQALAYLDVKAPQVLIDVLIVNVNLSDELKMGINWSILGQARDGDPTIALTQAMSATGATNPYGQLSFAKTAATWSISGLLDFVETQENVKILANPKILVLNNYSATIDSVEEIPYQELSETSNGGSIGTTSFKEAGVKLQVQPQISPDGYIIMHIQPQQSAHVGTFRIADSDTPVIETRKAETTLRVKDGQTIIIGGLRKQSPSRTVSGVPILGSLPIIGGLFRQTYEENEESELGVFITPRIYRDDDIPDANWMPYVCDLDPLAKHEE